MSVIPSDIAYYGSLYDPAYDGAATLNGAISSTTAATLAINVPTSSFPSSGEFAIQIDSEILWVTQGAPGSGAGTLTVIRGFGGTTAATHSNGASVTMPAGGGVDFLSKVNFSDIVSGDTADYISSATTDTLVQITLTGRDTTGVIQTETKTLNGQTVVTGSQAWDRLETAKLAAGTTSTSQITNSATTLPVTAHTNFPSTGTYTIQMAKEQMSVTAGQGTNSWTVTRGINGTTATVHQSGDNVYLVPFGDILILDHTKVISNHTAQTGSANPTGTTPALMKLQSGDGSSVSIGQVIRTQGGTGPQQIRTIIAITGYGTDVVAVSRSWGTVPDNTTTYDVVNGMQLDLSPNPVTECRRFLWNAAADVPGGSQRIFYQKVYAVNNNTATAFTSATVQDASNTGSLPGSALLDLATATAANDTVAWANRQTAPGSGYGSFVTQPAATAYGANSGNLANGAAPNASGAQGIVLRLTLPAGTTSYKGYADLRTQGTTT
jgi:hypothetical protein